ncbi:major facilitator superfamily domain-containing protein [Tribonema minus]|uniref:Major facilitator superfamily domain-containing protein n=1 Tax=Tribonema minus TaxID=303371 RepID=A0A835ZCI8_9STRA|nr:major facilitator superfamily domain-containing protein [Tribonema minus]
MAWRIGCLRAALSALALQAVLLSVDLSAVNTAQAFSVPVLKVYSTTSFADARRAAGVAMTRGTLELSPVSVRRRSTHKHLQLGATGDDNSEGHDGGAGEQVQAPAWVTLGVLLVVYISNQWSRNVLPYVVNFDVPATTENAKDYMNVALGFGAAEYGALASYGFTLLFSASSLAAGRAVDALSRKGATVAACAAWSLATAAQGLARGLPDVLALRVAQGVAQAFTTPAAYTMLADAFPQRYRATANAIYSSGIYVGGGLASLTVLINSSLGWRDCCLLVGGLGVATAAVAQLLLREESHTAAASGASALNKASTLGNGAAEALLQRGEGETQGGGGGAAVAPTFAESLRTILSSRTAVLVYAASAARFMAGFAVAIWLAPFFRGAFPDHAAQFAIVNAAAVTIGGVLSCANDANNALPSAPRRAASAVAGGYVSDAFGARDPRFRAWVPMAGSLLAVPMWVGTVNCGDFGLAMTCLFLKYVLAECWFGPTVAVLQASAGARSV